MTATAEQLHELFDALHWVGPHCANDPNGHHRCNVQDLCACTCHRLDNSQIGWLRDEMVELIRLIDPTIEPRSEAWICLATILAVWKCGTDVVRIQHALKKGPRIIARAAANLRGCQLWDGDTWHAPYAEEDATDTEVMELYLHWLVAEGKVRAKRKGEGFVYRAAS